MNRSSQVRWAVGTLAVVAIALSADSLRRTRTEFDAMHAPLVVIRHQLAAFSHNDYRAAYRCAAPEIQAQFPLSQFRRMVQQGYPQIARARSASLGTPVIRGDTVIVPVSVISPEEGAAFCVYAMRHCQNGWRVAGVQLDHTFLNPPALRHGAPARHTPKPREVTAADPRQPES